jgi:hypothetical protein
MHFDYYAWIVNEISCDLLQISCSQLTLLLSSSKPKRNLGFDFTFTCQEQQEQPSPKFVKGARVNGKE